MYACVHEISGGFFEGVCAPSNTTAYLRDPPPLSLKRRLVLPCSTFSGQEFARNTITVAIEVVWIAWVLLQHLLCFFIGREARAVQVAISPTPRTGHYNSDKCFILIFGCSLSVEGVGSLGSAWRIPPSELFYSEAIALRECFRRAVFNPA
jgi:hypothetical protein